MNKGSSPKCQDKSKKMEKSKELKEDSAEETVEHKKVPESENPKTEAKEEKASDGASDKKDKKEKKSNGCCKKCKAKAKMMKKKLNEESDEEDEKQKQKTEKGNPKTDTNEDKGSKVTSGVKDKKETSIITWRHKSTKKDKSHDKNLFNVNPPCQTARSMYHGGPNFSNPWNMYAPPRVMYPAFAKGPMYGQCGGGGGYGPFQPHQSMYPATTYRGAQMSPYPPTAAAAMYPPYWQSRPFTDANPITRYTTYRDNYSYFFI